MSRAKTCTVAMAMLLAALAFGPAQADLLYDHFGVTLTLGSAQTDVFNGGVYYPFAAGTLAPTRNLDTVDYETDDWHGSWSFTSLSRLRSGTGAGTVPTGGEPYDVEAIYFDNTPENLLIVMVTSFDRPPGRYEARVPGSPLVVSGDLALDLGLNSPHSPDGFSYDYGVNINHEVRHTTGDATSGGTTIGTDIYRTDNSDWYLGTPSGAIAANGELTNFDPNYTGFLGQYMGAATVNWYEYAFAGGLQECRYATYIVEITIPIASLGHTFEDNDLVELQRVMGCRNDGATIIGLMADYDVPEPGTMLLTGLGLLGVGAYKRMRSRRRTS